MYDHIWFLTIVSIFHTRKLLTELHFFLGHYNFCRVQLLRVLETRKTVLRKEQAMAFARAVAAGFDIDNLGYLIAFAERFGALRLM